MVRIHVRQPMSKKRSAIWKISTVHIAEIVAKSHNFQEVLAAFSLTNKGRNYKTLRARLDFDGIVYEHLSHYKITALRHSVHARKQTLEDLLANPNSSNYSIKKRLLEET